MVKIQTATTRQTQAPARQQRQPKTPSIKERPQIVKKTKRAPPSLSRNVEPYKPLAPPVRSFNKHVDAFVNTVLDPDGGTIAGYPGNTYSTMVAHQKIAISAANYSADKDVSLYVSDNPQVPVAFTNREAVAYAATAAPPWSASQLIEVSVTKKVDFIAPISFTNEFALFCAPVKLNDINPKPGYHMETTTQAMQLNVTFASGHVGVLHHWYRSNAGAFVDQTSNIVMSDGVKQISVPAGSTAFGFWFELLYTSVARFTITSNGGGTHGLNIGNHSAFCRKYTIPDIGNMRIERARLLGAKTWIKYLGDDLNNAGRMAACQMPPGVFPVQFAGLSLYDEIVSSQVKGTYDGAFKEGCVSRYIAPTPHNYELLSPPSLFGENGVLVHNWTSNPDHPQPYRITVDIALEYTTPLTFIPRAMPAFARPGELATAIEILNKMQVITENPSHEYVTRLWDKLKHAAAAVAASPKTWYTIAEVGGAALALL